MLAASELVWERFEKPYGAVNEWVEIAREHLGKPASSLVNGALRRLCREAEAAPIPPEDLLPTALTEAWKGSGRPVGGLVMALSHPYRAFWHEFTREPAQGLPGEPWDWEGGRCLRLEPGCSPQRVLAERAASGFFQNIAAARIAHAVFRRLEGRPILDLCAAPGGKSLQIARLAALEGQPLEVTASDANPRRFKLLESSPLVSRLPGLRVASPAAIKDQRFPCVLLDVPCGNSGVLAKSPEAVRHAWKAGDTFREVQESLLAEGAARLTGPGGLLFYGTCSLFPVENGDRARAFALERHFEIEHEEQHWPDAEGQHGAYLAILRAR